MNKWMRWVMAAAAAACLATEMAAWAASPVMVAANSPKSGAAEPVKALRSEGSVAAPDRDAESDTFRNERDRAPLPRDFVQQPPLIPHTVRGYAITTNFNKCMDCHAWNRARETGATKVSLTHFKDRDGKELSNVSPRRYFCMQCHVPQTDAKPLVANKLQRAEGLR